MTKSNDGLRLEVFLAQHFEGLSRHKAIEVIREGSVFLDGRKAKKGMRVSTGQIIELTLETRTRTTTESPTILFSNDELVIADKPAGMPCHPLRLGEMGTLLQWVGERFPEVLKAGEKPREGGLLHRLDTDTSGCVAFARTKAAYSMWVPRFLEGGIGKIYLAVISDRGTNGGTHRGTNGEPQTVLQQVQPLEIGKRMVIDIPLARHSSDAGRMVAVEWGDEKKRGPILEAKTEIRTLAKGDGCALIEAKIEKGRMHQIRIHLAAVGHPIIGDKLYGSLDLDIGRQALHAWKLILDKKTEVVAPLPKDMRGFCSHHGLSIPK